MPSTPILHLIAGVNGAGKTSFYDQQLRAMTPGAEYVCADEIAQDRWPGREDEHVEEAVRLAEKRRRELLESRKSFVAETVFSHESKLEFVEEAKRRGFFVILYHIGVSSVALARARIDTRVSRGGHDVPREKIEGRFERSLNLIPRAADLADLTFVYDNSGSGEEGRGRVHTHAITLERGRVVALGHLNPLPDWIERAYQQALARGASR
jgi:predicted ABC-type ATPase